MRREYGLSPAETFAELDSNVLTITLRNAISPMSRIVIQEDDGEKTLQKTFAILDDINRKQLDALVLGILSRSVWHSALEPNAATGDVLITFHLGA